MCGVGYFSLDDYTMMTIMMASCSISTVSSTFWPLAICIAVVTVTVVYDRIVAVVDGRVTLRLEVFS